MFRSPITEYVWRATDLPLEAQYKYIGAALQTLLPRIKLRLPTQGTEKET